MDVNPAYSTRGMKQGVDAAARGRSSVVFRSAKETYVRGAKGHMPVSAQPPENSREYNATAILRWRSFGYGQAQFDS